MNTSLRDALLQAGVVSPKRAQQQEREQQQERRQQSHQLPRPRADQPAHQPAAVSAAHRAAQQAQAAKVARDQELNQRRQEKAQRKARLAQIEQLIEQNRVPRIESEDYFSFVDGKKVRRLAVDAQRREQLLSGQLAVVRYRGFYAVVPAGAAERIRECDARMVVPHLPTASVSETDEAYKDFSIPDDLMW
ncbi:MAG TPA: DUF2058 domain-containing protein [Steroidobacteraceae bacterium]